MLKEKGGLLINEVLNENTSRNEMDGNFLKYSFFFPFFAIQ